MSTYDDASLIYYPSGYKASKAYSLKPTDGSGDLTFTRASSATRVNESGLIESVATGVPRIDYTGGGCAKLLLEPQRTNLVTQSVNLSSWGFSNWTKTINSGTAPDGTNTANLIEQATGGLIYANSATAESTLSVFLKYNSAMQFFQIMGNGDANTYANFDIVNGLVGNIGSLSKAEIKDYGSGWYRISMTILTGATLASFRIKSVTSLTAAWNNGTVFSGSFYAWGAQVETGYATSYIPTTSTAVTRVGENSLSGVLPTIVNDFTFFVDFVRYGQYANSGVYNFAVKNSTNTDIISIYKPSSVGNLNVAYKIGGVTTVANIGASVGNFVHHKIAFVCNGTTVKVFKDGALVDTKTGFLNSDLLTDIHLRTESVSATNEYGSKFQSILFYLSALTDTELETLTTL